MLLSIVFTQLVNACKLKLSNDLFNKHILQTGSFPLWSFFFLSQLYSLLVSLFAIFFRSTLVTFSSSRVIRSSLTSDLHVNSLFFLTSRDPLASRIEMSEYTKNMHMWACLHIYVMFKGCFSWLHNSLLSLFFFLFYSLFKFWDLYVDMEAIYYFRSRAASQWHWPKKSICQ